MGRISAKRIGKIAVSGAFAFVLTMGIVNLFSDMTYEGASAALAGIIWSS